MGVFGAWRGWRLSRRARTAGRSPRVLLSSPDVVVVSDASGHLSGGVVATGNVSAWVLGIKLLRLEADIALLPAHVTREQDAAPLRRHAIADRSEPPADTFDDRPVEVRRDAQSPTLRDARRLLRETDTSLHQALGKGSPR
jgi:hypothetical protein